MADDTKVLEDDDNIPEAVQLVDEHGRIALGCPCIRCGYNLRGLPMDINCPECGCPVNRTIVMIEQRALCPSCLVPVHPSATNCPRCGGPLNAAASIAGYAGGQLHIPANYSNSPSLPSFFVFMWIWWALTPLCVGCAVGAISAIVDFFIEPSSSTFARMMLGLVMLLAAVVFGAMLYYATRGYMARSRAYTKAQAEEDRREREQDAGEKPAHEDKR